MGDATDLLGLGLTCRYFLPEYTSVCICVFGISDHPQFVFLLLVVHISDHVACRSATALMEVERATPPGFEEEILKPPEVNNIKIIFITILTVIIFTILPNILMRRP